MPPASLPAVREPDEVRALGDLLAEGLGGGVGLVRDVHRAVASRTFGLLGLLGVPTRAMHDAISTGAYAAVRVTTHGVGQLASAATSSLLPPEERRVSRSRGGRLLLGALNGAIGDRLADGRSDAAIAMALRAPGRDLPTEPGDLAAAYPDATSRLVVFVHGLCETDEAWGPWPGSFGSQLRGELGYTPLQFRYNSGLHVSDNGRALARVLEATVERWPVPVDELVLVGHSMGGLVGRAACHYGHEAGCDWTERLRHVFCLGSPHLGAPLERAANMGGWALGRLPETRPFASLVNGRSAGIKDLRYGSLLEEDWCDCDPDELLTDRCCDVPFLETATYYFIGATVSSDPNSPLGRVVGDLLVLYPSASGDGRTRRIPFEVDHGRHLGGMTHFHLLRHPAVYAQLRTWLEKARGAATDVPS
jgi:pimeloyl-ACP methyl ester carboxylesterase